MGDMTDMILDNMFINDEDEDYSFFYPSRPQKPIGPGECPLCNSKTILKEGKYGRFYGCENFPKCKGTRKYRVEYEELYCPGGKE